jgi:hypothetical protein
MFVADLPHVGFNIVAGEQWTNASYSFLTK